MEKRPEVASLTQETYNFRMQKTAQDIASQVITPLRVRPESELRAENDVRREFALHGGFNAPMSPKSHSFSHY